MDEEEAVYGRARIRRTEFSVECGRWIVEGKDFFVRGEG